MRERLLAKSWSGSGTILPAATLPGHCAAVLAAARTLLDLRGTAAIAAADLPEDAIPRLRRVVERAAALHDLGKCSAHFQAMVRGAAEAQLVRHEAITAWLAWQEPLRSWLEAACGGLDDLALVLAAAAGHHRKFRTRAHNGDAGLGTRMPVLAGHPDVAAVLRLVGADTPRLADVEIRIPMTGINGVFTDLERTLSATLREDPIARPLLALAKAFVLAADVAGSAMPQRGEAATWMTDQLTHRADRSRLEAVVAKRLDGRPLRPFQAAVAACGSPLALVEAGCGSGKTVAAYAWFAHQHAGRQMWITYPTTGTALEGFRDYLHGIDHLASDLESGRREVDLELFDLRDGAQDDEAAQRQADRVNALRAWGRDAIACTVDTVLGLVQNQRKGLYAWPGLAQAAVVFDEVHAYDDRLFGCLLRFLEALPGIPALLMTASLPTHRRQALDRLCRERHGMPLPIIPGPSDLETLPRYRLHGADPSAAWAQVQEVLAAGGKVLWVANTVDRCLAAADHATDAGTCPLVYHSRFRYEDRVARHAAVIDGFRSAGPCLAVTTQVAEMSLDLSADLLVSDMAPVPALIQRLGRLNRRSTPQAPQPVKDALLLPVESPLPYDPVDLDAARAWVDRLAGGERSQRDLVAAWSPVAGAVPAIASAWIDGGLDTEPRPVRDGSAGITLLLPDDAERVRREPAFAARAALPMSPPRGADARAWLAWPCAAFLPVPPAGRIAYDPVRGARWQ